MTVPGVPGDAPSASSDGAPSDDPFRDTLAAALAPTYVLGFERDLIMPPPLVREVAAMIPGARYDELAGAGHWGLVLHPQEISRRVLTFLA